MSNITVCARFRPLSSKERRDDGDRICIQRIDTETFIFKVSFGLNLYCLEFSNMNLCASICFFSKLELMCVCVRAFKFDCLRNMYKCDVG